MNPLYMVSTLCFFNQPNVISWPILLIWVIKAVKGRSINYNDSRDYIFFPFQDPFFLMHDSLQSIMYWITRWYVRYISCWQPFFSGIRTIKKWQKSDNSSYFEGISPWNLLDTANKQPNIFRFLYFLALFLFLFMKNDLYMIYINTWPDFSVNTNSTW